MTKIKKKVNIDRILEEAWLDLGDTSEFIFDNPLLKLSTSDIENPHLHVLSLMRQPEYFWWTCKIILNIELLPMQCVVLEELWNRPFPMLIGSRGFGKSFMLAVYAMLRALLCQGCKIVVVGAAFRQSKHIFEYCDVIWYNAPILRSMIGLATDKTQGPRRDVDRCTIKLGESSITFLPLGTGEKIRGQRANYTISDEFSCLDKNTLIETNYGLVRIKDCKELMGDLLVNNRYGEMERPIVFNVTPKVDAYEITTKGGYGFKCSSEHKVLTTEGWKLAKDLTSDDYLIFDNKYKFPSKNVIVDGVEVDENLAWLLGILVAEGNVTNDYMRIGMNDKKCIQRIGKAWKTLDNNINTCFYEKAPYTDNRGWNFKLHHIVVVTNKKWRMKLYKLGLYKYKSPKKQIPWSILQSPKNVVISFLKGLFLGDGSAYLIKDKNIFRFGVSYCTSSEQLCNELHVLLRKINIFCTKHKNYNALSPRPQYMLKFCEQYSHILYNLLKIEKWKNIVKNSYSIPIKLHKGVSWYKDVNKWGAKVRINNKYKYLGKFFNKQDAIDAIAKNTPVKHIRVKSVEKLKDKDILYDFYLPQTNSFRASGFIHHNCIPRDIFETVVGGFNVVSAAPVSNVKKAAKIKKMKELGLHNELAEGNSKGRFNQIVLCGTADYAFNHFCEYWKKWKMIIESAGDLRKLEDCFPDGLPNEFNWKDYSIIRIPYELIPQGFMDDRQVARAKASVNSSVYLKEYGCIFVTDSDGFFKRTLIESCVTNEPIELMSGEAQFHAVIKGNPTCQYVFAIDPASERDNFCVNILEVHPDHRRIVYCWTTTRKSHIAKVSAGLVKENDFYGFCARKIRDLMEVFPCENIGMDSQGGGIAVMEALHDKDKLREGELPIWPIIVEGKPKDSDDLPGLHILELINFANADWTAEANHGLRKDLEDKVLLFPYFDTVSILEATHSDEKAGRLYDTLEDCVMEIEDLKDELTTIVHTKTVTGRDKWDTPETKTLSGKKGRMRKDRYSALVIGNMLARQTQRRVVHKKYDVSGGVAGQVPSYKGGELHIGPQWFTQGMAEVGEFGSAINRNR